MKKAIILFFIIYSVFNLYAAEESTDFSLKGGLYGNINLYSADFEYFSNNQVYHSGFSSATGLDFSAMIGGEYDMATDLFGFDTKYSFELLFSGLNANFENKDLLGYDIGIDDYEEINANYVIEPSINAVLTEHTLKTYFIKNFPLSVKTGFFAGIPLSKTYSQYTKIVSPEDVLFENGKKTANQYSGDIPEPASLLFGLTLGFGYDVYQFDNFIITPEIKFNYGLSNISSEVDWKINTVQAGISLNYRIPKAKVPPPAKPPMPMAPVTSPPPAEAIAKIDIEVLDGNKQIENTLKYDYTLKEYFNKELIIPVIFIDNGIEGLDENYDPDEIIELTVNKVKSENTGVYVSANIESEAEKDYVNSIISELKNQGVKENQISTRIKSIKDTTFKYPELREEKKAIVFRFDNGDDILTKRYLSEQTIQKEDKNITVNINVSDIEKYQFNAFASVAGEKINLNEGNNQIDLTEYFEPNESKKIKVYAEVKDDWQNTFTEEKTFSLVPEKRTITRNNYNPASDKTTYSLGFFDFDSEEIYGVDNNLKSVIAEALNENKQITLIALTDNLGINSYNERLAMRRAEAALKELNLTKSQVEIKIKDGGMYDNTTPYGRMLNRSVIIEIK